MKLSRNFISATRKVSTFEKPVPAPYFRKNIEINEQPKKAELSVCGLGFYRFWLDGVELTKGYLSPYISASDDILDYDVYDITEKLTAGKHTLAFCLGNGMQDCFGGYVWDFDKCAWRSSPKLAICLQLTDKNGDVSELEADESFLCAESPTVFNDLRYGECYDANLFISGWNLTDFDDSKWSHAISVEAPRGKAKICEAEPIVETKRLTAVSIKADSNFVSNIFDISATGYLYDFGLNLAGIPELRIKGKKGQKVEMIFGEYLLPDGSFTTDNITFKHSIKLNLPIYMQRDVYVCRGDGEEVWSPSFTYHGFRYAFVTGIEPEQATPELLTYSVMNTRLDEIGNFSCSDETLNALQKMVRRATLANFYHFPTDCPHREKNGWTADAALSVEHSLLNLTPDKNYKEWAHHLVAAMNGDGALPGIVPTGGWGFAWGNGPAWDQVLITLPYMLYRYRGDLECAETVLPALLRYVHYLTTQRDERGLIAIGLGDWCAPYKFYHPDYKYRAPLVFTDSVISMDICEKTAFLFEKTGQKAQADFCYAVANEFKKAIREHLVDLDTVTAVGVGTQTPGAQTSQAMAIFYNIFTEEEKPEAFRVLLRKLAEENDHLDTGVLGARVIFHVLSDFGYADYAYKIMVNEDAPSYGHWVARGETALPENLLRYDQHVDSLNHHFFGDVSAWFIKSVCGINLNPNADDIHFVRIAPHFISALDHAEAYHIAPDGKIAVSWVRRGDTVELSLTAPDAMTVEFVPDFGFETVSSENGKYILRRV